jgi:hypothetical protein
MTKEQLEEVNSAVYEMYTLEEIYHKIVNKTWTAEMFESFVVRVIRQGH